jgi:hypothetical protein
MSLGRWIGLGAVGTLAATVAAVAVANTGPHHPAGAKLAAGSAASSTSVTGKTVQLTGVWAPGGGKQSWRTGMTAKQFSSLNAYYTKQGLRIQDLRVSPGAKDYTAVWRPGAGAETIRTGLTSSQFKAANTANAKKGLRITSLSMGNGITAVWRPGHQKQTIAVGLTTKSFGTLLDAQSKKSMRPALLDRYTAGGVWHYLSVLESGTGNWQARTTTSPTVWHNDNTNYAKGGLRLVSLGSVPYTGVWRPGSGAWQVWTGPSATFKADDAKFYKQGLRLVRIAKWTS